MAFLFLSAVTALLAGCTGNNGEIESDDEKNSEAVAEPSLSTTDKNRFEFLLSDKTATTVPNQETRVKLTDVAKSLGLDFEYKNGATGRSLMVESMGGGCAWFDFDLDGQLDAYFVQAGLPDAKPQTDRPPDRLFQQLDGRFVEIASDIGIDDQHYGVGVTVGDFNNDGFEDVYVLNVGRNTLLENMGDGTFEDVTESSGVSSPEWSSSGAWADLDLDGDLDLFVCNYLQYDPYDPLLCEKDGYPAMCNPRQLPAWPDECYLNRGDGSFEPIAEKWGLSGPGNKALGVAIVDFDLDGWPDIYVANDTTANFLFLNRQEKGFEESALRLGCALSGYGAAQASMGIAIGDYDSNGLPDVFLTHFTGEANTLYQNQGEFGFYDATDQVGIREASWNQLGFGTVMQDFDLDGKQELFTANGHVDERNAEGEGYRQKAQLLGHDGKRWIDISLDAGPYFKKKLVGRGVSLGDFDSDGRPDLLVGHQNSPAALLRNESEVGNWLKLKFIGTTANRQGIGSLVKVDLGNEILTFQLAGGTSFGSSHEPAIFVGLGEHSKPVSLSVTWPGNRRHKIGNVAVNQTLPITEPDWPPSTPVVR